MRAEIKKYLTLIDSIIVNILGDLASFRVWLIAAGFALNGIVLYLVAFKNMHYTVAITSLGLLGAIYQFFFKSKSEQAAAENKTDDSDPVKE
jgi:hypothetical protein